MSTLNKLEYGDYQTPLDFCKKVVKIIKNVVNPSVILEPTFGIGNFIKAIDKQFDNVRNIYGIEINEGYFESVQGISEKFIGYNENIFEFNHKKIINKIRKGDELLIIGNPPWVTNSQMTMKDLINLPKKTNFKKLKGIEAITGASNFDICEYIILDLLNQYKDINGYIAMLCKTSVVTNIIKEIKKYKFKISNIKMYLFDAKKVFGVNCEACLFFAKIDNICEETVNVYNIEKPDNLIYKFGWKNNKFYSNFNMISSNIDGKFPIEWRQGIKHDCSKIMELKLVNNKFFNGLKEEVEVESNLVYPLLKSSDLKEKYINKSNKFVIVTQNKVKQNTNYIADDSPKLWNYLNKNKKMLDSRKSTIYNNAPAFSIFGIGDYSFYKYKVAVSGFYKKPNFVVLSSSEKAIMLDDTCYFIGFEKEKDAIITMILLNSQKVQDFLYSIAFLDKKRPYTKEVLMRIDLAKIVANTDFSSFKNMLNQYNMEKTITENDYSEYRNTFKNMVK